MRKLLALTMTVFLALSLTACGNTGEDEPAQSTGSSSPTSGEGNGDSEGMTLKPAFGETKFEKPVAIEARKGYSDWVYIVEQPGRIVGMDLKHPDAEPKPVLNIEDRVFDEDMEQGLLGLAFHPDKPDVAYVNYTTATHTVIAMYEAAKGEPDRLDPASEQVLLTFEQPFPNHNGGQLAFGPDGYLYIAAGDGGSGGDPNDNGQNLNVLLGKILRIDVDSTQDGLAYAIPADNPFIGKGAPEIYAYGLRNPWRFSFDSETGKLWAADVGQNRYEEINVIEKGGNYGWRIQEGTECHIPEDCDKTGLDQPVYTYGRDLGVSVTGGYVYRGKAMPWLVGYYVYGDYGSGTIWGIKLDENGKALNTTLIQGGVSITSFGRDSAGEIYVCTQEGEIYKVS